MKAKKFRKPSTHDFNRESLCFPKINLGQIVTNLQDEPVEGGYRFGSLDRTTKRA